MAIDNPHQDLPNSGREVAAEIASFPQSTVLAHGDATVTAVKATGFCIIAASAFVVQRFDVATIRFLEGYGPLWLPPLRQWRIRHYRDRKTKLTQESQALRAIEDQQHTKFQALKHTIATQGTGVLSDVERQQYLQLNEQLLTPKQQADLIRLGQELRTLPTANPDLMPTRLGNLLRAAERRPLEKYGLDAIICWSRLWMLLPDAVKKDLQEARADLNTAARVWLWSLLFCSWTVVGGSIWTTWPLVIGLLSAWFAYHWAIAAASTYGELIEAAFDLYRHLLYQSLRWYLNPDPHEERRIGRELTQYLRRGF